MNFEIEKAVLYNNRNLLISTKSNGILSFEEDFDISFSDAKLKGLSGLSANSGIIALGGEIGFLVLIITNTTESLMLVYGTILEVINIIKAE